MPVLGFPCIVSGTLASFGRSTLEDNSVGDNSGVASNSEEGQPGLIQRAENLPPQQIHKYTGSGKLGQ